MGNNVMLASKVTFANELTLTAREAGHTPTVLQEIAAFNRCICAEATGVPWEVIEGNGSGPPPGGADVEPPLPVWERDG